MSEVEKLISRIPKYARDIKINLKAVLEDDAISDPRKYGVILACAFALGNKTILDAVRTDAQGKLTEEEIDAALGAGAIMSMNNVYYRFTHMAQNKAYSTLPAKLRMQIIGNPGVDKALFELWSLSVSAINGCGMCIDAHEKALRHAKLSETEIQDSVRIAALVKALDAIERSGSLDS